VEPLDIFPFLSEIKPELDFIESRIFSAELVTLVAEPKLGQLISLSFIEASFLDNGILYNRKLVENIDDFKHTGENLCIYFCGQSNLRDSEIRITPKELSVELGQDKTPRVGKLDIVGMSACLALMIGGERVENLLVLILAGNWLDSNLDYTYDPVFTSLRDSLKSEGFVSIVSIGEVNEPDLMELPGINSIELNLLRSEWSKIDLNEQSTRLSNLVKPLLTTSIGVARLEELIWHRIVVHGWDVDLASQFSRAQRELTSSSNKLVSASRLIDSIIVNGYIN
tara:strand:- start:7806 stop:8651 length:846 start_codon:yes stop_codon:yes gene_type:complete